MSNHALPWRRSAAAGALWLVAGCAPAPVAVSGPAPSGESTWFHIVFMSNSHDLDSQGALTVADVAGKLRQRPGAVVTIIGRTDSVGGADYNLRLSHLRADAVRDALVYQGNVAADRIATRWTGETQKRSPTGENVASLENRVVDMAIE